MVKMQLILDLLQGAITSARRQITRVCTVCRMWPDFILNPSWSVPEGRNSYLGVIRDQIWDMGSASKLNIINAGVAQW